MKSKMKRPMTIMISMLLVVGLMAGAIMVLVGCGGSKQKIDIFSFHQADPYIGQVIAALKAEVETNFPDADITVHDGRNEQATQKNDIDTVISRGSDLMLVNIVTNAQGEEYAKTIKAAGIPAVFFNREIENAAVNVDEKFSYVGTSPTAAGYMQGELIGEMIKTKEDFAKYDRNGNGKIDYIMLRADIGNPEAEGRTKYSVEEGNAQIKKNLGITENKLQIVGAPLMAAWDTAKAIEIIKPILDQNLGSIGTPNADSNVDLIIANNDGMAAGAISALQASGFNNTGSKESGVNYIPVFGVDALASAVDAIKDGTMEGTVKQDPILMAKGVCQIGMNLLNDKDIKDDTAQFGVWDADVNKLRIAYSKIS